MSRMHRIIGVGFDHMHIGDQLAVAVAHPRAELVGFYDRSQSRASAVLDDIGIVLPVASDLDELLSQISPDIAFVCTTTADHPAIVDTLARHGVDVILEKPFADSASAAQAMMDSSAAGGITLTVNWPLAWVPSHRTARRLIAEGLIGTVDQVHFYDGNRGPLFHSHGKVELAPSVADKAESWWYQPEAGGGSMRDYLGYGTTLATWFRNGETPQAVTAAWHIPDGLRVDEQSVVIGHYRDGLSVFETRWGTHSDPWTLQPEPRCGYVITGRTGSITSWDYDDGVTVHRGGEVERVPNDEIAPEDQTALANLIAHRETGRALDGPMTSATSLAGHLIIEAAVTSARTGKTVELT